MGTLFYVSTYAETRANTFSFRAPDISMCPGGVGFVQQAGSQTPDDIRRYAIGRTWDRHLSTIERVAGVRIISCKTKFILHALGRTHSLQEIHTRSMPTTCAGHVLIVHWAQLSIPRFRPCSPLASGNILRMQPIEWLESYPA